MQLQAVHISMTKIRLLYEKCFLLQKSKWVYQDLKSDVLHEQTVDTLVEWKGNFGRSKKSGSLTQIHCIKSEHIFEKIWK